MLTKKFLLALITLPLLVFASNEQTLAYSTNMEASVVIGQINFTQHTTGVTSSTFPDTALRGLFVDPQGRLIVADSTGNRVLIWNQVPTTNGEAADLVLGQPDFTSSTANNGGRSAQTLSTPGGVYSDGTRLFVTDRLNGRVLIWNTFPTTNQQAANVVVGQPDMVSATNACDSSHLNTGGQQGSVWVYNGKLVVSSNNQQRVLIWNSVPTTNGVSADVVIGQANMTTCGGTNPPTQTSTNSPRGVNVDPNGRLFVVDGTNANRVLMWNSIPSSDNAPADVVIGQANFTSNSTTITAGHLNIPLGVYSNGDRLFIADNNNNRVLIWNSIPSSNGVSADTVLGQLDFTSNTNYGTTASTFQNPQQIFEYQNKLLVSEAGGDRILIFDGESPTGHLSINPKDKSVYGDTPSYTRDRRIKLYLKGSDVLEDVTKMKISENENFSNTSWRDYKNTREQNLSLGDGIKEIFVKYKDSKGNVSETYSQRITLDTTPPTLILDSIGTLTKDNGLLFKPNSSDLYNLYYYSEPNIPFTGSLLDMKHGDSLFIKVDGTEYKGNDKDISPIYVDYQNNLFKTEPIHIGAGEHTILLSARDKAGNNSDIIEFKIIVGSDTALQSGF